MIKRVETGTIGKRSRTSLLGGILTLLACASLVGCGGAPDGMVEVSGTVTWNGQPLETGFVSFIPDPSKSPQAGTIENGHFKFNAYLGQNVVRILSERKAGYVESMNQYRYEQFIPAKYNEESELSEEVSEDGENVFEFTLTGE